MPLTTIGCDKRAVGDHAVELLMRRIAEPDAPVRPVSYTHLDVYKRQIENCRMVRQLSLVFPPDFQHPELLRELQNEYARRIG